MTRDYDHDGAAVKARNSNFPTGNRTRTGPAGNLSDWPFQHNRSEPFRPELYHRFQGPIPPICLRLKGSLFRL